MPPTRIDRKEPVANLTNDITSNPQVFSGSSQKRHTDRIPLIASSALRNGAVTRQERE
jgi:hypothetical protein